jgi:uncharacterized membrane protein YfcA
VSALEALAVFVAGIGAGTINTVVGSGTLLTFPILLGIGYAPVVANVSNTIGLVPGSVSGAVGYRRELTGQRDHAVALGIAGTAGGITGAVLLLVLPASAFRAIVPVFIVLALALIVVQPRLARMTEPAPGRPEAANRPAAMVAVFASGVYGGYFGAAQGILLLAILGILVHDDLHRANALKNVLAGLVNLVAALVFIAFAQVAWAPVALLAAGSVIGGQLGARFGRRLPPAALRALVVAVGAVAIVRLAGA